MALALGSSASSLRVGSGTPSRMYRGSTAFWDADAADYVSRVQAADGEALELGVVAAYHAFCLGCKADGIWDALKASCILCGARTISGALVPLVGTAPTSYSFASGDYDRITGLAGDGSSAYLDTNRASNADGQDDRHRAVYVSAAPTPANKCYFGAYTPSPSWLDDIYHSAAPETLIRPSQASGSAVAATTTSTGLAGYSRANSSSVSARIFGNATSPASASVAPPVYSPLVFSRREGAGVQAGVYTDARLAFYSLGSALDLAALDARVSTLVSAIGTALS